MSMALELAHGLAWLAAIFFLIRGLCILNHMTKDTALAYKLSELAMSIAALVVVVGPLYNAAVTAAGHELLLISVALLWLLDRRTAITPHGAAARAPQNGVPQ